jgi:hypothetical protein
MVCGESRRWQNSMVIDNPLDNKSELLSVPYIELEGI